MSIITNVEIFETTEIHRFTCKQDAIDNTMRGYRIEDHGIRNQIEQLATYELEYQEGYLWGKTSAKWALIWWEK